ERRVLLSVLDRKWREHLYEMDYLKEGIGLRAMAQRDPLVEYQREGFDMFTAMLEGLKEESVGFLFNLQVEAAQQQTASGVSVTPASAAAVARTAPQVGRAPVGAAAGQPAQPAAQAGVAAPAALQAKGLDETERRLTYTGPDEGGRAHVARTTGGSGSSGAAAPRQGGTRKERRRSEER